MRIPLVTVLQRSLPGFLAALLLVLSASSASAQRPAPFKDPAGAEKLRAIVQNFLQLSADSLITLDKIDDYAADEFAQQVKSSGHPPVWFESQSYRVGDAVSLGAGDSLAMVSVVSRADSLPMFGYFDIDWTFFMRMVDGGWKVSALRRLNGMEENVQMLEFLDTTSSYPSSLKPEIARENSSMLLSNQQLRRHFTEHREAFLALATEFTRPDSLRQVGRIGNRVMQLNHHVIDWGMASHDIPQSAIDEYMRTASPEAQEQLRGQLKIVEKMRREGTDSLKKILKKKKLEPARIDRIVRSMHDLRVIFVNSRLPWTGAVQLTVGGKMDNAVGYIYSPKGGLPLISPAEYFYLEDLGDGWWIFRAT
jgi:hypothetical protein